MNWNQIAGQENVKRQLLESIDQNRVSHAQLFVGQEGYGTLALALAYAREIFARENDAASSRVGTLNHVDLHFSFPVFKEKNVVTSSRFFTEFREAALENPYFSHDDWSRLLESENKQLTIYADEIDDINKKFALKSFEGGTKILIIWGADKMNDSASNKLLKFLEEPPEKTVILLLAEDDQDIMQTILSRTQIVRVHRLNEDEIEAYLEANSSASPEMISTAVNQSQGNLNEALKLLKTADTVTEFEALFVQWVREAFQVKKKPEMLLNIIKWAKNIATWNREKQKLFLDYCAEMFRLAMMQNYGMDALVYKKIGVNKFNWEGFSKYVHGANIEEILEEISTADYHLQRNANAKIVWTDMGIKLSRYIHRSAN